MKAPPPQSSTPLRKARLSPYLFTFLAFIIFVALLYGEDFSCTLSQHLQLDPSSDDHHRPGHSVSESEKRRHRVLPFAIGRTEEGCDIFSGNWVRDESTRPLYRESDCPYIHPQLTCQEHGRPEKEYQFWRWEPHACSLPRNGSSESTRRLLDVCWSEWAS